MKKQKHSPSVSQLRIIGGRWRGRKLAIADAVGLRPTGDRIRETVFNWLMADLADSCCLDLFAGSGALGFECLSRGAKQVVMLENNHGAHEQLLKSAATLQAPSDQILKTDALQWLEQPSLEAGSATIAFIDPPFALDLWGLTCEKLTASGLLANGAKIYLETPKNHPLAVPKGWQLHREKHAGDIRYCLFEFESQASNRDLSLSPALEP